MRVVQMNPSSNAPREPVRFSPPPPLPSPAPKEAVKPAFDIKSFKKDDWILLSVIAILVLEGSRDYPLICALGYLFMMGL